MEMLSYYMMFHNVNSNIPEHIGAHQAQQLKNNGWTNFGPASAKFMHMSKHFFDKEKEQWYKIVLQFEKDGPGRFIFKRPIPMMIILLEQKNDTFVQTSMINGNKIKNAMEYCKMGVSVSLLDRVYVELQRYFNE